MTPTIPSQLETEPPVTTESPSPQHPSSALARSHLSPSLLNRHRTIPFPRALSWMRKVLAFAGPGYLVAVGYMTRATGRRTLVAARIRYTLLSVILISNLMAMFFCRVSPRSSASPRDATSPRLATSTIPRTGSSSGSSANRYRCMRSCRSPWLPRLL